MNHENLHHARKFVTPQNLSTRRQFVKKLLVGAPAALSIISVTGGNEAAAKTPHTEAQAKVYSRVTHEVTKLYGPFDGPIDKLDNEAYELAEKGVFDQDLKSERYNLFVQVGRFLKEYRVAMDDDIDKMSQIVIKIPNSDSFSFFNDNFKRLYKTLSLLSSARKSDLEFHAHFENLVNNEVQLYKPHDGIVFPDASDIGKQYFDAELRGILCGFGDFMCLHQS